MVLKRIFLILILPIFIYAQWTDPRPRSVQLWHMAEGVIDSLTVSAFYSDTLEAKETSLSENVGGLIRLNGLASGSNYGAGLFLITNTSYTPDGANVINLNSGSNQLVRLNDPIVNDTLKLKNLPPIWQTVDLKQLSSTNTNGGGNVVYSDSIYPEGFFAYDAVIAGKQWVRQEYPGIIKAGWAGISADSTANENAAKLNALIQQVDEGRIEVPLGEIMLEAPIVLKRGIVLSGQNIPDDNDRNSGTIFILEAGKDTCMLQTPFTASGYASGTTHYMGLENLKFDGNAANQNRFMSQFGVVDFSGAQVSSYMKNIIISNAYGTAFKTRNSDAYFENLWVIGSYLDPDSANYSVVVGDSTSSGVNGLFVFNSFYIENSTTDLTKSAKTDTTVRANAMLISQTSKVTITGMHTESHRRGVDIEGANFNIGIFGYSENWTDTSFYMQNQPRQFKLNSVSKGEYFEAMGTKVLIAGFSGVPTITGVAGISEFNWKTSSTTDSEPPTYASSSASALKVRTTSGTGVEGLSSNGGIPFSARTENGTSFKSTALSASNVTHYIATNSSGNTITQINGFGAVNVFTDIAGRSSRGTRVIGDTQDRFNVLGSGDLQWGDGTNPIDVNLKRASAGLLNTDFTFLADTLRINNAVISDPTSGDTYWKQGASSAPDTLMIYINSKWQKFVGSVNNP